MPEARYEGHEHGRGRMIPPEYGAGLELGWHASAERQPAVTPHERLHRHTGFRSRVLPDVRDLIVYTPPGYEAEPERVYPVLYLQDGQNLFDPETSYIPGQTWQVREAADAAIAAGEVEPLVIVGIYNTGVRRMAEYTHDADRKHGGGEAELYGEMLMRELMPWIAAHYRVKRGPEATGLGGSSLGGLVSLYLGLRHPERFGRLAVMSPSIWWNEKSILRLLRDSAGEIEEKPRIWLDVGDREGPVTMQDAETLRRRLTAGGWRAEETLHYERVAGGRHDEASWAERVRPMLGFLFPAG